MRHYLGYQRRLLIADARFWRQQARSNRKDRAWAIVEWRGSGRGGTVIDRRDEPSFGDLNQSVEIGKRHREKAS